MKFLKFFPLLIICCAMACHSEDSHAPGSDLVWNGKSAAVVLTYDDALNVHLDKVVPALDQRSLKGTFYLILNTEKFWNRKSEWAGIAANGHELGNHTMFHPCEGNHEGREWVHPEYDLSNYSVKRMLDEIVITNAVLAAVDGKHLRTFAYTCGDTEAGGQSFMEDIKPMFVASRGTANSFSRIDDIDLNNVNAFYAYNHGGDQLIELAQQAIEDRAMIVYIFHGVGGEHDSNVSEEAHTQLLDFLVANRNRVWVTTMIEAAQFVKQQGTPGMQGK